MDEKAENKQITVVPIRARARIFGVGVDAVSMDEAIKRVVDFMNGDKPRLVFTPNPEFILTAQKDDEFRRILNAGDLVVPDGVGVVWASRFSNLRIHKRVAGYDLCVSILACAAQCGKSVFMLGGAPGVIETAIDKLSTVFAARGYPFPFPFAGYRDGYYDEEDEETIVKGIKSTGADILLVGTGSPRQERFIWKYRNKLGCSLLMGVGGSFDVLAGVSKRAPEIWRNMGLEWLYRLIRQPSRIKRQIKLPLFAVKVLVTAALKGNIS